jgi:hypothetical protein
LHFLILKDWNKKKHWKNNNTITRVSYEERKTHNKIVPTLKPYTPHKDLLFICFCENPLTPFVILQCLDLQFWRFHSFSLSLSWVNYQFSCWRKKSCLFSLQLWVPFWGFCLKRFQFCAAFAEFFVGVVEGSRSFSIAVALVCSNLKEIWWVSLELRIFHSE